MKASAPVASNEVPAWFPEEWRLAANHSSWCRASLEARSELLRILRDQRMREVYGAFDRLVRERHASGVLAGALNGWLDADRRLLLRLMVAKGGYMPSETKGEIAARRKKIAKKLRSAIDEIAKDSVVADLDVEAALHWAIPFGGKAQAAVRHFVAADGSYEQGPALLTDAARGHAGFSAPRLSHLLKAVADRLENGSILDFNDGLGLAMRSVQPGRGQRAHLEAVLSEQFAHLARPIPAAIFAPVIEVALNLHEGSIAIADLAERLRKI